MGWAVVVLWSAEAKFRNGADYLEALKKQFGPWLERNSLLLIFDKNADASEHWLEFGWSEQPEVVPWGLLIGDALHNLRSSLDHAIYGLAVAKSGIDRPPHADALAFPICDRPELFADALDKKRLGNMASDATLRAAIEDLQPYRRPDPPNKPWLGHLRDLENGDKHRVVRLVWSALTAATVQVNNPPRDPQPRLARPSEMWLRGPIQERTVVMTFSFDRPAPDVEMSSAKLALVLGIELERLDGTTHVVDPRAVVSAIRDETRDCLDALSRLV